MSGYRRILRNRDYAMTWAGQTTSQLGDSLYDIALVWLALRLSHQSFSSVGVVIFARLIPYLFIGPVAGVYVDRWYRKRTMIVADTIRGLVVLAVPLLSLLGVLRVWHLAAMAFVLTSVRTFFNPALQASVPAIVSAGELLGANALLQASTQTMTIVGPALAGLALVVVSPVALFVVDAVTFFVSALTIATISLPRISSAPRGERATVLEDLGSTVRAIRERPVVLWNLVLFGAGLFAIAGVYRVGMPALAEDVLHGGARTYGFLMSLMGVGTVTGALVVGRLKLRNVGAAIFVGWMAWGAFFAFLPVGGHLGPTAAVAVLAGLAESVVTVLMVSLLQSAMPQETLGRVFSLWSLLNATGESTSGLLIGALLGAFSTGAVFVGSGLAAVGVGLVGLAVMARLPAVATPGVAAPGDATVGGGTSGGGASGDGAPGDGPHLPATADLTEPAEVGEVEASAEAPSEAGRLLQVEEQP